jgi:biopolymer transport protein ExbB
MEQAGSLGFSHFLAQTDTLGKAILVIMLVMSVATWYLILTKGIEAIARKRRSRRFLAFFWDSPSLGAVERHLEQHHPDDPFSHLAYHAIVSSRHHARHGLNRLNEAGSGADFLTRSIRRVIDEETAKLESGLTVLASVGSTAPFVGLFGTVWGVYHALVAIGLSGQGTLDRIAGPVGEALIMTALGLAVAIPAVLAYNALVRSNRLILARLDAFAHDLFAFLTTGVHFNETDAVNGARATGPRAVVKGAA